MTTCFWRSRHISRSSMPSGKHYSLLAASCPNGANQTCDKSPWAAAATQTFCPVPSLAWFICSPNALSELRQAGVSLTAQGAARATAPQPFGARTSLTPLFIWKSLALAEWSGLLLTQNQTKSNQWCHDQPRRRNIKPPTSLDNAQYTSKRRIHLQSLSNTLLKYAHYLKVTMHITQVIFFPTSLGNNKNVKQEINLTQWSFINKPIRINQSRQHKQQIQLIQLKSY